MRKLLYSIFSLIALSTLALLAGSNLNLAKIRKKSDKTFAHGVELYKKNQFQKAIQAFERVDSLDHLYLDSTSNRLSYAPWWKAACLMALGDSTQAMQITPSLYNIPPIDRRLTAVSDSLSALGVELYQQGRKADALKALKRCAELESSTIGVSTDWYRNSLLIVGRVAFELRDSVTASSSFRKAVDITLRIGPHRPDYLNDILWEARWIEQNFNMPDRDYTIFNYDRQLYNTVPALLNLPDPDYEQIYNIQKNFASGLLSTSTIESQRFVRILSNSASKIIQNSTDPNVRNSELEALNRMTWQSFVNESALLMITPDKKNQAPDVLINAAQYAKDTWGTQDEAFPTSYSLLVNTLYKLGKFSDAYNYGKIVINWYGDSPSIDNIKSLSSMGFLARMVNDQQHDFPIAKSQYYYRKGLKMADEILGPKDSLTVDLRSRLLYSMFPDSTAARHEIDSLYSQVEHDISDLYGRHSAQYQYLLVERGEFHFNNREYSQAEQYATRAYNLAEDLFSIGSYEGVRSALLWRNVLWAKGNNRDGLIILKNSIDEAIRTDKIDNFELAKAMTDVMLYHTLFDDDLMPICNAIEELFDVYPGTKNSWSYVEACRGIGEYYMDRSLFRQASQKFDMAEQTLLNLNMNLSSDATNFQKALIYSSRAILASNTNDYDHAIELLEQSIATFGKISNAFKTERPKLDLYNALSQEYFSNNQPDKAIAIIDSVISSRKQLASKDTVSIRDYITRALLMLRTGRHSQALADSKTALSLVHSSTPQITKATLHNNLSLVYMAMGDVDNAIRSINQTIDILDALNANSYANSYFQGIAHSHLAEYLLKAGRNSECQAQCAIPSALFKRQIADNFKFMTSAERALFWDGERSKWFANTLPRIAADFSSDSMAALNYDAALFSKGLLLSTDAEMNRLIRESGDSTSLAIYEHLRIIKKQSEIAALTGLKPRLDSLQQISDNLERQLLDRCSLFGDYTRSMNIVWKDVQANLRDGDMAIEFQSFPNSRETNETFYTALLLRKDWKAPKLIPICSSNDIDKIRPAQQYTSSRLSSLIWGPLEEYLKDATDVWFSPSGALYGIALESLPQWDDETKLVSDSRRFHRLSSTRNLAYHSPIPADTDRKAVVYGALKYDSGEELFEADINRYGRSSSRSITMNDEAIDFTDFRNGVAPLPATLEEARNASKSLQQMNISTTLLTDSHATEGSFKALSGSGMNVLHIATHGFYWSQQDTQNMSQWPAFISADNSLSGKRYAEDRTLSRAGLLFSGANRALTGAPIPDGAEDGILTAREIASLNLNALDLVVLSACQTALGDISGEGVFGLQRGFKKAGAGSMVMSLWKVDDAATGLLMTEFYRALARGDSKQDALLYAQKKVRNHRQGDTYPYAHPRFWAAFILLD